MSAAPARSADDAHSPRAHRHAGGRSDTGALAPLGGHRVDVHALRGIAVAAVVAYHAGRLVPGGFVGVDMFFVISGYVIGRGVVRELRDTGTLSFRAFYARRARRLLPALGVLLTVVVLLSPLLSPQGAASIAPRTAVAAALFAANAYLYRATSVGYFDPEAELNPLLHTWSLSVEEQFYFVMPLLTLLAWKLGALRGRALPVLRLIVGLVIAVSLVACLAFTYTDRVGFLDGPRTAFFSPLTRAWQFAIGVSLVLLPTRGLPTSRRRSILLVTGLAAVGVSMASFSEQTRFPGVAAAVPTLGTALIIYAGTQASAQSGGGSLNWRLLTWLGDISYSWYLWHWPVIIFAIAFWPADEHTTAVLAAALSIVPAWLSHRWVERPLRAQYAHSSRATIGLGFVCVLAPIVAFGVATAIHGELAAHEAMTSVRSSLRHHADYASGCDSPDPIGERPPQQCAWGPVDARATVVLIGDSNAGQFSEAMSGAAERLTSNLRVATLSACPFIDAVAERADRNTEACRNFVARSVAHLERYPPNAVVIGNATEAYVDGDLYILREPAVAARAERGDARARVFDAGLRRVVRRLRAAGSSVAVIQTLPKPTGWDPRACSALRMLVNPAGCAFATFDPARDGTLQSALALERRAVEAEGGQVWSFESHVCPGRRCSARRRGGFVWRDGGHISVTTAESLAPEAERRLARLLQEGAPRAVGDGGP